METEDKFKFTRKLSFFSEQTRIVLPKELIAYLELEEGDSIYLMPDTGKHGKFCAIWKKGKED